MVRRRFVAPVAANVVKRGGQSLVGHSRAFVEEARKGRLGHAAGFYTEGPFYVPKATRDAIVSPSSSARGPRPHGILCSVGRRPRSFKLKTHCADERQAHTVRVAPAADGPRRSRMALPREVVQHRAAPSAQPRPESLTGQRNAAICRKSAPDLNHWTFRNQRRTSSLRNWWKHILRLACTRHPRRV